MDHAQHDDLRKENQSLNRQLQEYKELVDAIKNGSIDALAINKNGEPEIFALESTDYVYRVLVENFAESALNVTDTGLIVYANSAFDRLLNAANATLVGANIESFLDSKSKKAFKEMFRASFSGTSKGELVLSYNGKKIPVYVSMSSLYPRFPGIGIIITDLTEKKEQEIFTSSLEHKISERTAFIQQVIDSSVEAISTFDKDLNYTSINKTALQDLALSANDIIGKNVLEIFPHLKETAQYQSMQRALGGETVFHNNIISQSNGTVYEAYFKPLIVNEEITGVLLMARDITTVVHAKRRLEEMNRELEVKNTELMHTNTELASFSYIASHDLQEPLRKIQAFTGRILDKQSDEFTKTTKDYFTRIIAAAAAMQNLIDALHAYSRTSVLKPEFILTDLNQIMEDVKRSMQEMITSSEAVIDCPTLPTIRVIPLQMHQVFSNLINNAIKFRKPKERPYIKITAELISEENIKEEVALPKRKYWKISVTDNGIGFEKIYGEKIFELFQKLHGKDAYSGTGIGLSICKKIIQNHKGLINVNSEPGMGTTFNIYLPART
ncbi:MAG: sensor signal transduction histidine kinase [Bacteroidetes bacterium]|nr:sensor signal transduction histidine kinase [Bacteroidota bacterium]